MKTHEGQIRDPCRGFLPAVVGLGFGLCGSSPFWVSDEMSISLCGFFDNSGNRLMLLCRSIVTARVMISMIAIVAQPQPISHPPSHKSPNLSCISVLKIWLVFCFLNFGFVVVVGGGCDVAVLMMVIV